MKIIIFNSTKKNYCCLSKCEIQFYVVFFSAKTIFCCFQIHKKIFRGNEFNTFIIFIGKGIASLTFDSEFQRKRRDAIKKRGKQNFGESLARSSKGLAMGIFEGVTGVAMKPIEGAKQEGVGGFFKGMGKGVVGLVARPTGGIVDFASGTFDSVKRVTETSQEIGKKRPARFLKSDGITRPYNLFEAEGWKFLRDLEKGKYSESDTYVTHEEIPSERKEVFLVTNRRILVMNYQNALRFIHA